MSGVGRLWGDESHWCLGSHSLKLGLCAIPQKDRLLLMTKDEEKILRQLLWFHHGCPQSSLYGDDGEMQCNNPSCMIDFKRMDPSEIRDSWQRRGSDIIAKAGGMDAIIAQVRKDRAGLCHSCGEPADPRWSVHTSKGPKPACDGHGCAPGEPCAFCRKELPETIMTEIRQGEA